MNVNPYESPEEAPPPPAYEPSSLIQFLILSIIVGLMTYGLVAFMEDVGVIVRWKDGSAHFWFER